VKKYSLVLIVVFLVQLLLSNILSIVQWFRNEHKLDIGTPTGEAIKKTVGSAMRMKAETISVKGRDLVSGIPKVVDVSSDEIRQALKDPVNSIVEAIRRALEQTPPELSADIIDRGIILTGGNNPIITPLSK